MANKPKTSKRYFKISPEVIHEIWRLRGMGAEVTAISKQLGITKTTVLRYISRQEDIEERAPAPLCRRGRCCICGGDIFYLVLPNSDRAWYHEAIRLDFKHRALPTLTVQPIKRNGR